MFSLFPTPSGSPGLCCQSLVWSCGSGTFWMLVCQMCTLFRILVHTTSVAFSDIGTFILLALDRPLSLPLSLQVLIVHRLSGLERDQVSCTFVVASPYGLSLGTPLLCHCWLLLAHWSVCDCWKSGSCQLSKHQLCRTEASVLLRGVPELQQSFINISAILQTLVYHVLDSLYSCCSLSIGLMMT